MRVFAIDNNKYVTVERNYKNVGFDLKSDYTRIHSGLNELFRYFKNKRLNLLELELGLLEACQKEHKVLEFGDINGSFMFSFNEESI
jgi:hypothetical protein